MKRWILLLLIGLAPGIIHGSDSAVIAVGRFSEMVPGDQVTGWEPMAFDKIDRTRYALVEDEGRTVLRADSNASASGLVKKMDLDSTAYPVLAWHWKVSNILANGDVTKKSGDDYPARIYITFADDPGHRSWLHRTKVAAIKMLYGITPPSAALAYVWGSRAQVESVHPNPYTDRVRMIVVESGPAHLNSWRSARRNIVEDFQRAFGTDPTRISGIAVMTDTDNTGESAIAWYGDILLSRGPMTEVRDPLAPIDRD